VASQVSYACHRWILPERQLVLRVAVTRNQLAVVLRPQNGTHLQHGCITFFTHLPMNVTVLVIKKSPRVVVVVVERTD